MCSALYQLGCALAAAGSTHKQEAKEASWVRPRRGNLTPCQSHIPSLHGDQNKAVLTTLPRSQVLCVTASSASGHAQQLAKELQPAAQCQ